MTTLAPLYPSLFKNDPEILLLLYCALHRGAQSMQANIQTLLSGAIDWERLLHLAEEHRVTPLLWWNLQRLDPTLVPEAHRTSLETCFKRNCLRNLRLTQELVQLVQHFETNGIRVIPFKGPLLAFCIYDDLALRYMGDLDLLVRPEDAERAEKLLKAQGFYQWRNVPWESHFAHRERQLDIDLHVSLIPQHLASGLDEDFFWQGLATVSLAGKTISAPSPEQWLMILCLNGTKDSWPTLNRICDLTEFIAAHPTLDWPHVLNTFEGFGLRRVLGISLWLAHSLLNAPLPKTVLMPLMADKAVQTLVAEKIDYLFQAEKPDEISEVSRSVFNIRSRERVRDKLACFLGLVSHSGWFKLTENDTSVIRLPKSLHWLYYLLRPLRILSKYSNLLNPLRATAPKL